MKNRAKRALPSSSRAKRALPSSSRAERALHPSSRAERAIASAVEGPNAAQYDEIAALYAKHAEESIYNVGYERPAMLALLPADLSDRRILDAGCAAGAHAGALAGRGAQVVGIDSSSELLERARTSYPDVEFHQADLSQPVPFLADGSFDIVFSSLTMHYLADWSVPLEEFRRVLRSDGTFLMSTHHPAMTTPMVEDYFVTQCVEDSWRMDESDVKVSFYHRPLSAILDAVRDAGFNIDRVVEPRFAGVPTNGDEQKLAISPWFLIIRANAPQ